LSASFVVGNDPNSYSIKTLDLDLGKNDDVIFSLLPQDMSYSGKDEIIGYAKRNIEHYILKFSSKRTSSAKI